MRSSVTRAQFNGSLNFPFGSREIVVIQHGGEAQRGVRFARTAVYFKRPDYQATRSTAAFIRSDKACPAEHR